MVHLYGQHTDVVQFLSVSTPVLSCTQDVFSLNDADVWTHGHRVPLRKGRDSQRDVTVSR